MPMPIALATALLFMTSAGIVLLVGGLRDWRPVTDPPKELALIYTQSLLRVFLPRPAMRVVSCLMGAALLGFAARALWMHYT
jgi:hypothetical protein